MEGALLITLAIVSMSTGTIFIWVAATFEMGPGLEETIAFVDGPTNAFTACARISASVRLLKVFIFFCCFVIAVCCSR
jgi:hypothetical protein